MRNRVLTVWKHLPQLLVNYKGKNSYIYPGETSLAKRSQLAPPTLRRDRTRHLVGSSPETHHLTLTPRKRETQTEAPKPK